VCGNRFNKQYGELPPGYDHKYVYSHFGYNLKATDMQAAIGVAQLKKLPEFIEKRKRNWNILREGLSCVSDGIILPEKQPDSDPSWFGFFMTCKKSRDKIVRYIEDNGVQTRMLFAGNLIKHPCFDQMRSSGTGYRISGELPNTDIVMNSGFWVGVYPGMSEEMLQRIIETIRGASHGKA
ncbi:MAG: DegT/DnrJ/EryC1/StrS family aminotransferase, partial [Oscillospiraceae bacterium]|nr:DegT/DnrJ/EryC1/StrS family aminotransferase [Oscillospiraceae bacterium]